MAKNLSQVADVGAQELPPVVVPSVAVAADVPPPVAPRDPTQIPPPPRDGGTYEFDPVTGVYTRI